MVTIEHNDTVVIRDSHFQLRFHMPTNSWMMTKPGDGYLVSVPAHDVPLPIRETVTERVIEFNREQARA